MSVLVKAKQQVAKIFQVDSSDVFFDRKASHDNYIYLEIGEGEFEVRVEMDNEDHDWWVDVKNSDGEWQIHQHIITI